MEQGIGHDSAVLINGKEFKIERSSGFGFYATAKVTGNVIAIKLPIYLKGDRAAKTFQKLKDSMVKRLEAAGQCEPRPEYLEFYDGQQLSLMGKMLQISIRHEAGKQSRARLSGSTINITLAEGVDGANRAGHIYMLSRKAISRAVMPEVMLRINELNAKHFGFSFEKVRIKDQIARWGSYSKATSSICLNFRLLFAPPEILDYVIVHELAHIKECNHSKRFWKLVVTAMPDYKARRKWLRKNGNSLGVFTKPQATRDPVLQTASESI